MSTPPKRLPGDRGHLGRLLELWARDTEELVTSGRLRHLVGVTAIIQMLDGLKDEEGRSGSPSREGLPSSSGSVFGPGHRTTLTALIEAR